MKAALQVNRGLFSARLDKSDVLLLCLLGLFALLFRIETPMVLHTGVDSRDYWAAAQSIVNGSEFPELTHRTSRWPLVLPIALGQAVFGVDNPNAAYFVPWLFAVLQAAGFYMLGRLIGGRALGFFSALAISIFPYSIRAGSQLMPETVSLAYIAFSLWMLLKYFEGRRSKLSWLLGSAVLLFVAYQAKISNLYFLPGYLFALWFWGRQKVTWAASARASVKESAANGAAAAAGETAAAAGETAATFGGKTGAAAKKKSSKFRNFLTRQNPALIFAGALFCFYLLETAAYALFTDFPLGQLQIILSTHLGSSVSHDYSGFFALFLRYAAPHLQLYWQLPFLAFGILAVVLLFRARRVAPPVLMLLAAALSFFVCITFGFRSLDPLVLIERYLNRYFMSVLVPVLPLLLWACFQLFRRFVRLPGPLAGSAFRRGAAFSMLIFILLAPLLLLRFPGVRSAASEFAWDPGKLETHPLSLNVEYAKQLRAALEQGVPIVAGPGTAGRNALQTARSFYMGSPHLAPGIAIAHFAPGPGGELEQILDQAPTSEPSFSSEARLGQEVQYIGPLPTSAGQQVLVADREPFSLAMQHFSDFLVANAEDGGVWDSSEEE